MNYSDLSEETQLFLNKVMDIYAIIKDKTISKNVNDIITVENYVFTKLDKKVLSLFIAGFLVDGKLKEIFSQYDDNTLDSLFEFIGIQESDIIPIQDEKYEEYFQKNLKIDLMSFIIENMHGKEINFITPEVIVSSLRYVSLNGSDILDYFARNYKISGIISFFCEHPLFRALENYTLLDGSVSKIDSPRIRL